jgi:hypothetical protein
MRGRARGIGRGAMPRRIVERRIHQHASALSGEGPRGKCRAIALDIEHDARRRDRIRRGVAARKFASAASISTSTSSMPATRRATASPPHRRRRRNHHAIARRAAWRPPAAWRRGRRDGRISIVAAQLSAEKGILGDSRRGSVIGPQFVGKPGIGQELARLAIVLSWTRMRRGSTPSEPSMMLMFWSSTR